VELDIVFIYSLRSFTFGRRKSAEHRGIGSLYDVLRHCVDGFLSLKKTCLYYIEMSQHPNTPGKTSPRHVDCLRKMSQGKFVFIIYSGSRERGEYIKRGVGVVKASPNIVCSFSRLFTE
jgi:hypothetical protein